MTEKKFKTITRRVNYVGPGFTDEPDGTIRGRTWEQVVNDAIDAGGQFITVRYVNGFDEVTVRVPE